MTNTSLTLIVGCFFVIAIVWFGSAFINKRTVKNVGGWHLRITALVVVLFLVFGHKL